MSCNTYDPRLDSENDAFYDEEFWQAYNEMKNGELITYESVDALIDDIKFGPDELDEQQQQCATPTLRYRTADLFAGIGGIRMGFEHAARSMGAECENVFTCEWDKFARKTYCANFDEEDDSIAGDITEVVAADVPDCDILMAGFPCTAFSRAGKAQGFNDNYKGRCRGTLFLDVARIADEKKPAAIFCENVKNLINHDKGNTYKVIKETFEQLGYKVFEKVLDSADYGVAQRRERIYIVAFREDIAPNTFEFPEPTTPKGSDNKPRVLDILDDAPVPARYYISEKYLEAMKAHKARHAGRGNGFGYRILDLDGVSNTITHSRSSQETNWIVDAREHDMESDVARVGKLNDEDIRRLTPREWARLQGFPEDFVIPVSDTQAYCQFGNSVSVPVIEAVAKKVLAVLEAADLGDSVVNDGTGTAVSAGNM